MSDGNNSNNTYFDFSREGQTMEALFDTLAALDEEYQLGGRLLAALDKDKLDGIEEGAEVNKIAAIFVGDTELTPSNKVVTFQTDSEPTYGSVKLVLSGDLYNKFVQYYTKSQVHSLIAALHQFVPVVADSLPEASADTMYLLYLIPSTNPKTRNAKDEFITIRSGSEGSYTYSWEQIGTTTIDISGKADKDTDATEGNLAVFDSNGNPVDAGESLDDINERLLDLSKPGFCEGLVDTISAGTEQEIVYRQSGGDGVNCIKRIKGKTVAWNQLCPPKTYSSTVSDVVVTSTGDGKFTLNGTASANNIANQGLLPLSNFIPGHKGFVRGCLIQLYNNNTFVANLGNSDNSEEIVTVTSSAFDQARFNIYIKSGVQYSNKVLYPQYVDLTLLYGSEISGMTDAQILAKFQAEYPELYYPYNAGKLRNNDAEGLETGGFNRWDEEWVRGDVGPGGVIISGSLLVSKNLIPVFAGETYYMKFPNIPGSLYYYTYDINGAYITFGILTRNTTFVIPDNVGFIRFADASYTMDYANNICISISSSRNGQYEPYWKREIQFRIKEVTGVPVGGTEDDRVTIFPDGLRGAGSAFDSLFVENGVTKARKTMLDEVDLGDLAWYSNATNVSGAYRMRSTSLRGIIKNGNTALVANIICPKYVATTPGSTYTANLGIAVEDNGDITIYDTQYNTADSAAAFKAAMDGVKLIAEAATPIIYTDLRNADGTPFELPKDILVDELGTERALFPESADGSPSAPLRCDSTYSISIANLVRKLSE